MMDRARLLIRYFLIFVKLYYIDCSFYEQVLTNVSQSCVQGDGGYPTHSVTECVLHYGADKCMDSVRNQNGRCYCVDRDKCQPMNRKASVQVLLISAPYTLLTKEPICYEGKNNGYASFNIPYDGRIRSFKLVYVSGTIYCAPMADADGKVPSTWGCNFWPFTEDQFLTMISDDKNKVLVPTKSNDTSHIRLQVPGQDKYGKELVLKEEHQFELKKNQELRVWYSEDFYGVNEHDNFGKQCIRVYAQYC